VSDPLDLAIAPNGNIVVSANIPLGRGDAVTTIREYDAVDGHLVRVFRPEGSAEFRRLRGLRFGAEGNLYCVARDDVTAFDFMTSTCVGAIVECPDCMGQALLIFFPVRKELTVRLASAAAVCRLPASRQH
jgi:hypothetical protein